MGNKLTENELSAYERATVVQALRHYYDILFRSDGPHKDMDLVALQNKVLASSPLTLPQAKPDQLDRIEQKLDKVLASVTYVPMQYVPMPPLLDDFDQAMEDALRQQEDDEENDDDNPICPNCGPVQWSDLYPKPLTLNTYFCRKCDAAVAQVLEVKDDGVVYDERDGSIEYVREEIFTEYDLALEREAAERGKGETA